MIQKLGGFWGKKISAVHEALSLDYELQANGEERGIFNEKYGPCLDLPKSSIPMCM